VYYTLAFAFTFNGILRHNKKNYENSNISPCKNVVFKKSSKKNRLKNHSRNYNFITNLSQVSTQAKISSFKNPHIKNKIDLLLLPRGL
jgi:hypothetical protein